MFQFMSTLLVFVFAFQAFAKVEPVHFKINILNGKLPLPKQTQDFLLQADHPLTHALFRVTNYPNKNWTHQDLIPLEFKVREQKYSKEELPRLTYESALKIDKTYPLDLSLPIVFEVVIASKSRGAYKHFSKFFYPMAGGEPEIELFPSWSFFTDIKSKNNLADMSGLPPVIENKYHPTMNLELSITIDRDIYKKIHDAGYVNDIQYHKKNGSIVKVMNGVAHVYSHPHRHHLKSRPLKITNFDSGFFNKFPLKTSTSFTQLGAKQKYYLEYEILAPKGVRVGDSFLVDTGDAKPGKAFDKKWYASATSQAKLITQPLKVVNSGSLPPLANSSSLTVAMSPAYGTESLEEKKRVSTNLPGGAVKADEYHEADDSAIAKEDSSTPISKQSSAGQENKKEGLEQTASTGDQSPAVRRTTQTARPTPQNKEPAHTKSKTNSKKARRKTASTPSKSPSQKKAATKPQPPKKKSALERKLEKLKKKHQIKF